MKILARHIERDGSGHVTVVPEVDEDLYHLYNLIQPEDLARASAVRRVQSESSTGSVESHRVRLQLTVRVAKLDFEMAGGNGMSSMTSGEATVPLGNIGAPDSGSDPNSATSTPAQSTVLGEADGMAQSLSLSGAAQGEPTLHISGRVAEENPQVRSGSFHTLDIELQRKLTITKEQWDEQHLKVLEESGEASNSAELGAVILGEGKAIVTLLTNNMTLVRQRIQVSMPRKRSGAGYGAASGNVAKLSERFNTQVYNAVVKLLSLPSMRVVILASPGFWRDSMYDFLLAEAVRRNDKILLGSEGKRKLLKVHSPNTHIHSLVDVLKSPEVAAQLQDTKFARENRIMDQFLRTLSTDDLRAWYGERAVVLAASRGAIGTLLISDALLRNAHPVRRKQWMELFEQVKGYGGTVVVFSSLHESGRQLNGLGGAAALLTYPLDLDLVEEEEVDAAKEKGGEAIS
ncbi:Translation factor pelota [Malassezia vespertilionis]|uniref:Dom34p n=1 Tax=Malassezia vespertilionis TaxID=2020962 RepID=A0A2N1JGR3_9BASI|nr:Translation factor pelota [Malassezia vespertilionis]PKI85719.1 Dom34p [Malassezia vespertilionis]WFD05452.1 Translation factor pelota [Malassezia vespertilionis]